MKKAAEAKTIISDLQYAIEALQSECESTRNIVARYHAKYGETIQDGELKVDDDTYFSVVFDGELKCSKISAEEIGIEGNYQRALKIISKLSSNPQSTSKMKSIFYQMAALAAIGMDGYGIGGKKQDRSSKGTGLPYFDFEVEGKKYTIQAVNQEAANEKLADILKKKKA